MNEAPDTEDEHDEADRQFHNGDEDDDDIVPVGVGARLLIKAAGTVIDIEAADAKTVEALVPVALDAVSKLQTSMQ